MVRLAAGNRGGDRRDRDAAVDPEARQRQPARAEMALLQLADEAGDQPFERLARGFGMSRGFFELDQAARRRVVGYRGQRLRLAAEQPVERKDNILFAFEPARERE